MAGEDRYDSLLLKAEGKQSDRHDEAFEIVWDELEKGFFESFGRGRRQAQARRRAMPAALEAMTARRNAALAPAVRTMGGIDSPAPMPTVVEQPTEESVVNTTEPYQEKDVITDGADNDEDPLVVANEEEAEVDQAKIDAFNARVNQSKVDSQQEMRAKKKKKKKEEPLVSDIPEATSDLDGLVMSPESSLPLYEEEEPEEEEPEEEPEEESVEGKAAKEGFKAMNDDPEPEPEPPKEEKITAENMLEVIKPFTQTPEFLGDKDVLQDILGLMPTGKGKTETVTEEVAEEEAQVELPKRMWQVASDGTVIGSKITKKKAEKLLEGDATFDGKVLQLNRPPTEKEKKMASSKYNPDTGKTEPIKIEDDLVEDPKVEPPKVSDDTRQTIQEAIEDAFNVEEDMPEIDEGWGGDDKPYESQVEELVDGPDLGPEDGMTIGDMMEMPNILDKPKDEPDKAEDFVTISAGNAKKYWPIYMAEAEAGNLLAAKHLRTMFDDDIAEEMGLDYDETLEELEDLIRSNTQDTPPMSSEEAAEAQCLNCDGTGCNTCEPYTTHEEVLENQDVPPYERQTDLQRLANALYNKEGEQQEFYDFDELESEPPILEPADILAGLSLGRKFAQGSGQSKTNESVFMYWNKEGDPVGMKILDPNSTRMLNIGQTELPGLRRPTKPYGDMFHEFETQGNEKQLEQMYARLEGMDMGTLHTGDPKKPLEWKDEKERERFVQDIKDMEEQYVSPEKRQEFYDQARGSFANSDYRVTEVKPESLINAIKLMGKRNAVTGKSAYRTFAGPAYSHIDDVPGLDTAKKKDEYAAAVERALRREHSESPKKVTTKLMLPAPFATDESGELIHPNYPEAFETIAGEGMSSVPIPGRKSDVISIKNILDEMGPSPTTSRPGYGTSRSPMDSRTIIQGTPAIGRGPTTTFDAGDISFIQSGPRRLRNRDAIGRKLFRPIEGSTEHATSKKDLKALLGGKKDPALRDIGNQAFAPEMLQALRDWPTKDMTLTYPGEGLPGKEGPLVVTGNMREGVPINYQAAPRAVQEGDPRLRVLKSQQNANDDYSLLPSSFFDQGQSNHMSSQDNMSLLPAGWGDKQ